MADSQTDKKDGLRGIWVGLVKYSNLYFTIASERFKKNKLVSLTVCLFCNLFMAKQTLFSLI